MCVGVLSGRGHTLDASRRETNRAPLVSKRNARALLPGKNRAFIAHRQAAREVLKHTLVVDRSQTLHEKVERWGAEARKLAESGREVSALDLYRQAADAMPGAPWLQLRTGELSKKLRQNEQAVIYFVRAADAFLAARFDKRAVPALRSAWSIARQGAPRSLDVFLEVTRKLARLQLALGLATDASVTIEYANDTLRRLGLMELKEAEVLRSDVPPGEPTQRAS